MASTNVSLEVTLTSDGSEYHITSNDIVSIVENSDGGSDILIDVEQQAPIKIVVDEAPGDISDDTDALIEVTTENGTEWLNANRVIQMTDNDSGCTILYRAEQQGPRTITIEESSDDIQTAMNALNPTPVGGFVDTTSNQSVEGEKTWVDPQIFESVNQYSLTTSITAFAGGGQGSAVALTTEYNNVTVCATASDSVKLPAAVAGNTVYVKNNGAATLAVFPATGDTIDGGSANASVLLPPGVQRMFSAINTTDWESDITTQDDLIVVTGITAHAGGGQGSAVALTGEFNNITTCATAGDSVLLPVPYAGAVIVVENNGATSADVFPAGTNTINGGSASAAVAVPAGARKYFVAISTTAWLTGVRTSQGKGSAALPAVTFDAQPNMGMYWISSTQLGFSVSGALVGGWNATGLFTGFITEQTTGSGITLSKNKIQQYTATALNSTGTITAAMVNKGLITSTSAAAVLATLDTAANIGTQVGAADGTSIEFIVDNTAGANTVTVAVAAGITVCSGVVTGSDTLTVSVANAIGIFRLVFSGAAVAKLYRIG